MALLSSSRATAFHQAVARPRSRVSVVSVKALSLNEAADMIGGAFVKIMSPPQSNVDKFPVNDFSGKISHHDSPRKPFKDGYSSNAPVNTAESSLEPISEPQASSYVEDAVRGVVAGLPSTSSTEPNWTGQGGWTGDVHTTDKKNARDGFHTKKY